MILRFLGLIWSCALRYWRGDFSHLDDETAFWRCSRVWCRWLESWCVILRPFLWTCSPSPARLLIFIALVAPGKVLLSSPLPKLAERSSETWEWDIFPVWIMDGDRLVSVSCKRAPVHHVVIHQTRRIRQRDVFELKNDDALLKTRCVTLLRLSFRSAGGTSSSAITAYASFRRLHCGFELSCWDCHIDCLLYLMTV